jgi:hypothetical protein
MGTVPGAVATGRLWRWSLPLPVLYPCADVFSVEWMALGRYNFRSWNQLLSLEVYWSL